MANLNLSQFGENTSVSNADYTFVWDSANAISKKVSRNSWLNSGTLTSDAPVTISQTWNQIGTAFTALKVNAVSTASAAGSLLLDLQLGGVSQFSVQKNGSINANSTLNLNGTLVQSSGNVIPANALILNYFNQDVVLLRDASNTLALRNGTSAQTFNVYGTSSASNANYARLALTCGLDGNATISTQALGTGTAGVLAFSPGNSEKMRITTAGNVGIGTTAPRTKFHLEDLSVNPNIEISGTTIPNYTGVGFVPQIGSNTITRIGQGSLLNGGLGISGFSAATNGSPAVSIVGYLGPSSPTQPAFAFYSFKHDGSTGRAALASTEINSQWLNGTTPLMTLLGGGNVGIGTTAPTAPLEIRGAAVTNTRENLLKCTMNDAGNDAFHIYNGTGLDTRFSPAFSGSVFSGSGAAPALNFVGQTTSANDTGTVPLSIFQGRITSSETDPNNGTFSNVVTRPLFGWWNVTTPLMQLNANGNLGIGTTSPTSKLQVTNGDVEIETVTSGIIMKAAGTANRYRITLNAGGTDFVITAL